MNEIYRLDHLRVHEVDRQQQLNKNKLEQNIKESEERGTETHDKPADQSHDHPRTIEAGVRNEKCSDDQTAHGNEFQRPKPIVKLRSMITGGFHLDRLNTNSPLRHSDLSNSPTTTSERRRQSHPVTVDRRRTSRQSWNTALPTSTGNSNWISCKTRESSLAESLGQVRA